MNILPNAFHTFKTVTINTVNQITSATSYDMAENAANDFFHAIDTAKGLLSPDEYANLRDRISYALDWAWEELPGGAKAQVVAPSTQQTMSATTDPVVGDSDAVATVSDAHPVLAFVTNHPLITLSVAGVLVYFMKG